MVRVAIAQGTTNIVGSLQSCNTVFRLVALFGAVAAAVQPVKVQGSDFVNSVTNARFQIIGVAYEPYGRFALRCRTNSFISYQPGGSAGFNPGSDPLSNGTLCLRDAALMQRLGVNTIRVYNLDPTINHDMCASIFNAVGIYMLIDVNSPLPNQSLNPGDLTGSYTSDYLNRIFQVVEAFKDYPNTLGFFGGNENMNSIATGGPTPPYLRAVTRDLKNYIAKHSTRTIPIGYSAAHVREILADSWAYLSCDIQGSTSDMSRIDFFGLNSYSWCGGDATFQSSGYDVLVQQFSNNTIPVFFSEYGCNKVLPRVFDEVQALYGSQMTPVMSGGLVYEYAQEPSNNFGLVVLNDNGTAEIRTDYDNLQKQFNKLDVKSLESSNSSATMVKSPTCTSGLIASSSFNNSFTLPSIPPNGQKLIDNGISKPNNGKLVSVTQTQVPEAVYASNGTPIQALAISPLPNDQSNTPNGQDTSGSATSSSSPSGTTTTPTPTKKSAAGRNASSVYGLVGVVAVLSFILS